MSKDTKRTNVLIDAEDNWVTNVGASFPGEKVIIRGKDLFTSFYNKKWMELLLYSITGRNFTSNQIKLLEGIWVICTSYPEPRVWNNRVSALAGNYKSTGALGLAAGIAVSEANIYGMRPIVKSFDFLVKANENLKKGISLELLIESELKKNRTISGYGRPIVKEDERIKPLMRLASEQGLNEGVHTRLAFEVEKMLIKLGYRMKANIAAIAAGLVADQGLSCKEYYYYLINCFTIGLITCHLDASSRKEGTFFPLQCNRIFYQGSSKRSW